MTEPMKTAADFLDKCDPYADDYNQELVNAVEGYAAQQVTAYRERIKMYMKGRLDKCKSEIKDTSVDSCAMRLLQGHKYELSHLLKEIDSL